MSLEFLGARGTCDHLVLQLRRRHARETRFQESFKIDPKKGLATPTTASTASSIK
jgi:hypothetical protein